MTELLRELDAVVSDFGFDKPQCYARDSAYNFIRTHHAEIAEALRDAAELRRQLGMMTNLAVKLRKDIDAMSHDDDCGANPAIQSTLCPCGSSLCNGEENEA